MALSRRRFARAAIISLLVAAAFLNYQAQLTWLNNSQLIQHTTSFDTVTANFCLTSDPKMLVQKTGFSGMVRFSARVSVAEPLNSTGILIGSIGNALQGDCYRATVRVSPGMPTSRIFFIAKLIGRATRISSGASGQDLKKLAISLRHRFMANIRAVTPDAGALVAGLSIGDDTALSPEMVHAFKVLSLTHLTAVSGTNCAIVLALVWFGLGRFRIGRFVVTRWPKLALSALVLACYVLIVGPQPSVLRAGAMTLTVLLAKTLGRGTNTLNALMLSALLLVACDPWLLFDYGFWLSVLACVGILVLAPRLASWLQSKITRLPKWLGLAVSVSFSAQLLCFPVLLLLQPGFSTYSVIANLLAEPMVLPVTVLGIIAVVGCCVCPALSWLLTWVASVFGWLITLVALWLVRLPAAVGYWPSGSLGVALATVLAASALVLGSRLGSKPIAWLAIATVIAIAAWQGFRTQIGSVAWAKGNWFIVSCNVGQGDATVIRSRDKVALIDVGRDPAVIDSCLNQLAIKRIDFLQLTHFDLDHVGGLAGALDNRQIGMAMLSPFVDARPGAMAVKRELLSRGVRIELAETGLSARFGDFDWQVLSPHAGAPEADSANDGSITMLWRSNDVDIITLADLGEKGQRRLMDESAQWFDNQLESVPLIMKVSHHGSADQFADLIDKLRPEIALISVGRGNSYGHPTQRTLDLLTGAGAAIERTDEHGSISVGLSGGGFRLGFQGEQGKTG